MQKESLPKINKIMLATGAINYMATHIHTINREMSFTNGIHGDSPHRQSLHEQQQTLSKAILHLDNVMQCLAEYMNGYDCLTSLDTLLLTPVFEVVSGGKDDVNRTEF